MGSAVVHKHKAANYFMHEFDGALIISYANSSVHYQFRFELPQSRLKILDKHKSKIHFFSRDEATLYERVSVCPLVGPLVGHAFAFRPTRSG